MIEESNQRVVAAVSTMKEFEKFMKSDDNCCIIMNFHISLLEDVIKQAHGKNKEILVHLDLIKGLACDESGCEFACQRLQADGIISTKGKVIETAKKNKKIGILRFFLIDFKSLERGIALCNATEPDYVEVLPGTSCSVVPYIKQKTNVKVMCGGLLRTEEDIARCFEAGACAVTISGIYDKERKEL